MSLTLGQTAGILSRKGFRAVTDAQVVQGVKVFQDAYRLGGELLTVDGVVGEKTAAALLASDKLARDGHCDLSPHFAFAEFACPCRCRNDQCRGIVLAGALVDGLEKLRAAAYPDGLHIIDSYRCPQHNGSTDGAAKASMHLYGAAADIQPRVRPRDVDRLGVFAGRGWNRSSGLVCHVDVRGVYRSTAARVPNPDGGTVVHPADWSYAR